MIAPETLYSKLRDLYLRNPRRLHDVIDASSLLSATDTRISDDQQQYVVADNECI